MLTTLQMNNCFQIKTVGGTGTAFIHGDDEGWFFLSAEHVLRGMQSGDMIYLKKVDDWVPAKLQHILCDGAGHDLVAFSIDVPKGERIHFNNSEAAMEPGAEVKFLGFPHGLESNYPSGLGFSTPLVRTAHLSGIIKINNVPVIVFDGFNNPGYSGGPVYWVDPSGNPILISVISSYRREIGEARHVFKRDSEGVDHLQPDLLVRQNSGMIYGCTSDRIREMLHKFPYRVGFE